MTRRHQVRVGPLPAWLDRERLLGVPHAVVADDNGDVWAVAELDTLTAADLLARLRGLSIGARALACSCDPGLPRAAVRKARLQDARRRRDTTAGFTRKGVRMDETGRLSLTPEALARELATHAAGLRVLDATCGVGGNAIAFARAGCEVTAVEQSGARLSLARHNASVYGVADRIRFVAGDACELVPQIEAQLAFVDPPWVSRERAGVVPADLPLLAALLPELERFGQVWLKLPPGFDERALPGFAARAVFGHAPGDYRRIKFLWLHR